MTKDEHRKLQYLLKQANMTSEELDERFHRIDKMMQSVTVGSIVYEADVFDGAYPQRVIEIVDADQGIIRTYEESIKREQEVCILERHLTAEDACRFFDERLILCVVAELTPMFYWQISFQNWKITRLLP